ncbi:hypothetical protein [Ferruginibacter sp. HRS2-29]|uniref:hypothetical protein n=1 Tax=Ferruginibacter sp. HRS2-29 TaxID=2487334 RepID=UPI0020CD00B4|nr:hypothetical protein [Ferruginibacter sp. HRS2-29]MCP9751733.1 hypothetical protein [Ferruginibacter sp. HRS2-29]
MKKIIMASLCLIATYGVTAQTTRQLETEDGIRKVSINKDGSSEISFSMEEFSEISDKLSGRLCITIGSQKKNCRGGIGFKCGIFDCPMNPSPGPQLKHPQRSRQQEVELKVVGKIVVVKFINPVDWDFLSNN